MSLLCSAVQPCTMAENRLRNTSNRTTIAQHLSLLYTWATISSIDSHVEFWNVAKSNLFKLLEQVMEASGVVLSSGKAELVCFTAVWQKPIHWQHRINYEWRSLGFVGGGTAPRRKGCVNLDARLQPPSHFTISGIFSIKTLSTLLTRVCSCVCVQSYCPFFLSGAFTGRATLEI